MLSIKLKPGQRIDIGDDVSIMVALDSSRKLTLRITAPREHRISWIEPAPWPPADHNADTHNI